MSTGENFRLAVVTPERAVLECDARFAAFPAWDGEIGVLARRSPLLCRLGIGTLRAETSTGAEVLYIDGGFAQMVDNKLTILTEQAKRPAEIDVEAARADLAAARETAIDAQTSWEERDAAIRRAQSRLDLVERD